jgi:hypothetical protein
MRASGKGPIWAVLALTAIGAGSAQGQVTQVKPEAGTGLSSRLYELATDPGLAQLRPAELNDALSLAPHGPGSLMRDGDSLVVEARTTGGARKRVAGVRASGAEVIGVSPQAKRITAEVEPPTLERLAAAPGILSLKEVLTPMTNGAGDGAATSAISTCKGSITTEADTRMKAAAARTQFDVDGSGVKVGLLSDSYNIATSDRTTAAQDVASGDLPGPGNPCGRTTPVQVLAESGVAGDDEGRGMAQLVHDLAPGASLAFATGVGGQAVFADNIRALASAGAKVIVDDLTYFGEPMFQDGPVAVAVNDVTAQGVAYYSSAANNNSIDVGGRNIGAWEAPSFRANTCPPALAGSNCMDFNPAAGVDTTFAVTLGAGRTTRIILNWAEPWDGVSTDIDLYALNSAGTTVLENSVDVNPGGTEEPSEVLGLTNPNASSVTFTIAVRRFSGAATPRVKFITTGGPSTILGYEYPTSNGGDRVGETIFGHNGAANAVSTAAVRYNQSAAPEPFSSRGPVVTYFGPVSTPTPAPPSTRVLAKPDLAAIDGGQTTFFFDDTAPFTLPIRFFGTSAAAPDAAAVAALQLSANPALSQAQVKAAQKSTASPVGAFGPTAVGGGLVNAVAALAANPPAAPSVAVQAPAVTKDRTPAIPFTASGHLKTLECSIDGAPGAPCTSPLTPADPLSNGAHQLTVAATDYFAQVGSASGRFKVDTKKPKVKFKKAPAKRSTQHTAKFKIKTERGAKLTCKLDRKKAKKCKSKVKFRVGAGKHKLKVAATDAAGNVGRSGYKWKVI